MKQKQTLVTLSKKEKQARHKTMLYNRWLWHKSRELKFNVLDRLWLLGHTFDQQPKHIFDLCT